MVNRVISLFNDTEYTDATLKTIIVTDKETGEVIRESTWSGSQNQKGWFIMYRSAAALLASAKISHASTRLYLFFTAFNNWEGFWIGTKSELAKKLGVTRKTIYKALAELKQHDMLIETRQNGMPAFFLNPIYATQGRDRKARERLYRKIGEEQRKEIERLEQLDEMPPF